MIERVESFKFKCNLSAINKCYGTRSYHRQMAMNRLGFSSSRANFLVLLPFDDVKPI